MIQIKQAQWLLSVCLVLLLSACTTLPAVDTMNKRMALVEITYGELLDTAILYKKEKRLTASQQAKLTELFDKIDQLRAAAYAAIEVHNTGEFSTSTQVLMTLLQSARTLLAEAKP